MRVEEDDGDARRWAEDPGTARRTSCQRVEHGALACARRPKDEDHERRVQAVGPHSQVPGKVVGELSGSIGGGNRARFGRNPSGGEGLESGDEDAEAVGSDVGHKVRIVAATDGVGFK